MSTSESSGEIGKKSTPIVYNPTNQPLAPSHSMTDNGGEAIGFATSEKKEGIVQLSRIETR